MKKLFFIILFMLMSIVVAFFFEYRKNSMIDQFLHMKTKHSTISCNLLYHNLDTLSKLIFDTQINTKRVVDILKDVKDANLEQKKILRKKLYLILKDKYKLLKHYNIKQLHFYLPNDESFLRFNKVDKFGYSFVYPLFDEQHQSIGSVELSFSMVLVIKEMIEYFHLSSNFIIKKSVINKKVFKSELSKYTPSIFNDYYFEKDIFDYVKKHLGVKKPKILSESTKSYFYKHIDKGKPFSVYDTKIISIVTFIPVKNPVDDKVVGAVVVVSSGDYIIMRKRNYYRYSALVIISLGLLLYLIYRKSKFREELQHDHNKLQTIIEEADSGIAVMDIEGNFLEVNHVYFDLFGYTKEELLHLNCLELAKDKYASKDILEKAKKDGKISKYPKKCIKKDSSEIYVTLSLSLLPSKQEFVVVINSMEDTIRLEELNKNLWDKVREEVSKNREKEKTMLHQSRLAQMGEMISMIAHQWRQPLSAITATCADLEAKIILNRYEKDLFKDKLHNISEYSQHLSKTIDDFRDFYKSNKQKQTVLPEDIFNSALNIVGASIKNKNIEIKKEFIYNETIVSYPNELKQVALNLIKNAEDVLLERKIKNPVIILKIFNCKRYVHFTVGDNAGGVPEDIMEKIFDPYFTTKEKLDGTGLGLYMSKIIIREHCKGLIEVTNSNVGAVFSIKIPLDFKDKNT